MNILKVSVITVVAVVGFVSCKTTEANYRAAYEATRVSQADADSDDGLDENTRRLLAKNTRNRQSVQIVDGDTIAIATLFIKLEENQAVDRLPQYSVVSNAFSQVFNARALCKRLQEAGFDHAYIFRTSTPDYYVAAAGSDNIAEVPAILKALAKAGNPGSRAGFPAVIRNAQYRPKK